MLKLSQTIIVEGNYDKIRLSGIVDANILTTNGFRIFKDKKMMHLICEHATHDGIIILTDSDRAGFMIRNHIKGACKQGRIVNAYIPEIFGKEKRKTQGSKEGLLGVEGMSDEIILKALTDAVASLESQLTPTDKRQITMLDFFEDGLSGAPNSAAIREKLCNELCFPKRLSQKALINSLNSIYDYDTYKALVLKIKKAGV